MTSCWSFIQSPQRKVLGTSREASVLSWSRSRSEPVTDLQSLSIIYDTAAFHAASSCSRNLMLTCVTLIYWSHYIWYSRLTKSRMHWTGKRPFASTMVLGLLHLSLAFETVDHGILLDRPRNHFGVSGQVLMWSGGFQCFRVLSLAHCYFHCIWHHWVRSPDVSDCYSFCPGEPVWNWFSANFLFY